MLVNFSLLLGLLWRPMTVAQRLRDRAPVAFSVFAAWLMAFLYLVVVIILANYAQGGRWGDFESSFQTLPEVLMVAGLTAMKLVLFVAVVYAPFAILISNL